MKILWNSLNQSTGGSHIAAASHWSALSTLLSAVSSRHSRKHLHFKHQQGGSRLTTLHLFFLYHTAKYMLKYAHIKHSGTIAELEKWIRFSNGSENLHSTSNNVTSQWRKRWQLSLTVMDAMRRWALYLDLSASLGQLEGIYRHRRCVCIWTG